MRAFACINLGTALTLLGQGDQARSSFEMGVRTLRDLQVPSVLAAALHLFGAGLVSEGHLSGAATLLEEAAALYTQLGLVAPVADLLLTRGQLARFGGDHARARELLWQSLALRRAEGSETRDLGVVLSACGDLLRELGDQPQAVQFYHESLEIAVKVGDRRGMVVCQEGLAALFVAQQQAARATPLLAWAGRQREVWTLPVPPVDRADRARVVETARAALGLDSFAALMGSRPGVDPGRGTGDLRRLREARTGEAVRGLCPATAVTDVAHRHVPDAWTEASQPPWGRQNPWRKREVNGRCSVCRHPGTPGCHDADSVYGAEHKRVISTEA